MIKQDQQSAIELDHLDIGRGHKTIIEDVTLSIPKGTVFGLIGPSGSGKTTLIRGLLGLSPVRGGSARILGFDAGSASLRSRIGYMPQDAAIYPDLSCRENLEFFASIYRVPGDRIDRLIELLDLQSVSNRPVSTYSGGQRQRVALAAAMVPEPDLMLLDEPTVGLDPRLRRRLWQTFAGLASNGTTLLISTHVMDEAQKCERIAFLSEGRLVATGSPLELQQQAEVDDLESAVLVLTAPQVEETAHVS